MNPIDSFSALDRLEVGGRTYDYYALPRAAAAGLKGIERLPYCLKVLLENLLRHEDGDVVTRDDLESFSVWARDRRAARDLAFHPARIMMPDSSGVPLLADLAAMRDAMYDLDGDVDAVNPRVPVDLVVDHSVIVDHYASPDALERNAALEYERNGERYAFLRWAQGAFRNVRIVPPGVGICHQVNVEFLSTVVTTRSAGNRELLIPDSLLGMDSHTPMINALGILGWGVGGIEAASAMLGQPVSLRMPEVVGVRMSGKLPEGVTATDLVLTITERLRAAGVVQKFVEFFGPGVDALPVPDRATCANMAPEYGATMGYFPVDRQTIDFLRLTGREPAQLERVEAYARAQGIWRDADGEQPVYSDIVELDLSAIEPSMAGPRRPQDRVAMSGVPQVLRSALDDMLGDDAPVQIAVEGIERGLHQGDVAIAAISSCTNTSNPANMLAAGLVAQRAVERGLTRQPWVKTSLSPGSRVVADYLDRAGLQPALDALGFNVTGFGCMTCMGNSGPLAPAIAEAIDGNDLVVGAVVSSNRNFEGRIHPQCRVNFLASPPLVVAYALAGSLHVDLSSEPLGYDVTGEPVYLADLWPSPADVQALADRYIDADTYRGRYATAFDGDARWQALPVRGGDRFEWDPESLYIRRPPFFREMPIEPPPIEDIRGARALLILGDSITTDHISPVAAFGPDTEAGRYLVDKGVAPKDFNSYAARRVNHDVMLRGTFANIRLRNEMLPERVGGWTRHVPSGDTMTVHEAAMRYARDGVPLVVVAGKDYGAGSSRDWAAKGTRLLGALAVLAEGFERIHRSNLIGMGVLPLQFKPGDDRERLGLNGSETFDLDLAGGVQPGMDVACTIRREDGSEQGLALICRLDTAREVEYWRHGGILCYVLRDALGSEH